jgi:hypothetical protein
MGLLIQHGGDIHIESDLGETAIQVAQRMCPEVLTKLVELGVEAGTNITNPSIIKNISFNSSHRKLLQ